MELYEFNKLDLTQRSNILWNEGVFITHSDGCALYILFKFYAEVIIHNDAIVDIKTFIKGNRLNKYLDKMDLPKLF